MSDKERPFTTTGDAMPAEEIITNVPETINNPDKEQENKEKNPINE